MLNRIRGRLLRSVLVVGAASAALSLAGPDALVPFKDAAAAAATVGVAFVIDFGPGSGKPVVVGCVHVPPSDNGYYALAAFTAQEHLAGPTFNSANLLCSIGGYPTSGCGAPAQNGEYYFWSYWYMTDGSGQWTYADRGPSAPVGDAVDGEDVEGWSFQNPGPDDANASEPGAPPDYAAICPVVASSPAPASPAATGATSASGTAGASGGGTGGGGSPSTGATTSSGAGGSSSAAASGGVTTTTRAVPSAVSHAPGSAGGHTSTTTASKAGGAAGATPTSTTAAGHAAALGPARVSAPDEGGGGSLTPLVIGGALVALLAAAAAFRWRRRPRAT